MTGLNHAATGALVAVSVKQPALALSLAFLAHFAVDAIPHWSYGVTGTVRKIVMRLDLVASLSLLITLAFLVTTHGWLVIACGLLCILPDAMWLPEILEGKPPTTSRSKTINFLREFHRRVQWKEFPAGIYVEIVWFAAVLTLILKIGR